MPHTGWLKQQKRIISQLWRLEIQEQSVSRIVFSEAYGEESISCLSYFPVVCWFALSGIPWLVDTFLDSHPQLHTVVSLRVCLSLYMVLCL